MTKTVNKEAIEEWVEALRSGQYEQGVHHLRNKDETYCCLGVVCDLFKEEVGGEWKEEDNMRNNYTFNIPKSKISYYGDEYMPDTVVKYLGLDEDFLNDTLTEMNDSGRSFEEIADKIEKELNKHLDND